MEKADWNPKKPYDLRERVFEFGCLSTRLVQYLHTQGPVAVSLSEQIITESDELVRIIATVIRKSEGNS